MPKEIRDITDAEFTEIIKKLVENKRWEEIAMITAVGAGMVQINRDRGTSEDVL